MRDSKNLGVLQLLGPNRLSPHVPFVDDTGNAQTADNILQVIRDSVLAAYIVFGFDGENLQPCLNRIKWAVEAHYLLKFLGYFINTRTMSVAWPQQKREQLAKMMEDLFHFSTNGYQPSREFRATPKRLSEILGLIRNACYVSVLGNTFSLRLQYALTDAMRQPQAKNTSKTWWAKAKVLVPPEPISDMYFLWTRLLGQRNDRFWSRSIGLLVDRDPTFLLLTDASYEGLGGYSPTPTLKFMWRLTHADLEPYGINLHQLNTAEKISTGSSEGDFHINVLEFVALVFNFWIALKLLHKEHNLPPRSRSQIQEILRVLADNTSALSWLKFAARIRNPGVRALALFLNALLTYCNLPIALLKEHSDHIKGKDNTVADALSRPSSVAPSWASVIATDPLILQDTTPFQVPLKLISRVFSCLVSQKTGDISERAMTNLWRLRLETLPPGWQTPPSPTNISGTYPLTNGSLF
jgi:hypothetical protein